MKLFFPIIFKIFLILTLIIGCATTGEIKGTNPAELLKQGVSFSKKGQYNRSISYFNRAIKLDPMNDEAYFRRGWVYDKKGQYEKAISDYTEVIKLNPKNSMAYNNRGWAYLKGKKQYDEAILDFTKAIELNPNNIKAYSNRGYSYYKKGQYDKAISDYSKILETNPRDSKAYSGRGIVRYHQGEYDSACSDVQTACDLGACKNFYWLKNKGYCQEKKVATTHLPDDISLFEVMLHSPQIPKVSTPEGIMASIEFQSERSLEGNKLVLILDFQVNQGGVSSVRHYLYEGKTPRTPKHGTGLFSISPSQLGQIKFLMYTPQIKGPPSRRTSYQSYPQGSSFWLQGDKNVSIFLSICQDDKCRKTTKISNSIVELVKFK